MKIKLVEIFDVNCEKRTTWHPVFVRITTDCGISGIGEAGLAYDTGHSAAAAMIKEFAELFLINFNPNNKEQLWNKIIRESFWGLGGGPVIYSAISAIDTALWDIQGKSLNVPVYQLLGGKTNVKLKTYASQLQFGWDNVKRHTYYSPDEYQFSAEAALNQGFNAVKVDPMMFDHKGETIYDCTLPFKNKHLKLIRQRLQAIRNVLGEDGDIIFECHSLPSVTSALQLGEIAQEFNCLYFEEPVNYLNSKLHKPLKDKLKVPIAAGERLYLRHGVREYIENQTVDILQPDIGLCGGLSEAKKICDYAEIYDIKIQAHVCGGPVATAASLHLETAIPNFIIHEHHTYALKDFNRELCIEDLQPENGYFKVSNKPGLGITLNDSALKKSNKIIVK